MTVRKRPWTRLLLPSFAHGNFVFASDFSQGLITPTMLRTSYALLLVLGLLLLNTDVFAQAQDPNKDPDKDEFIEVSEEPRPLQDIQRLVEYPAEAQRKNIEGRVTVTALINESGQVTKVEVDKSDDPLLTEAAIQAMKRARFSPAMQGKKPIKVWYTQTILFKLNGSRSVDELPRLQTSGAVGEVSGQLPKGSTATKGKAAVLIGKAPALPINIAGATTMELEITVGMYGDVLNVQPVDPAHKAAFTAEAEKIVRALKFLPGEIDNQARMTRTRITFKLK